MAQHGFPMGSHAGNGINPNDLAMSFQNNFSGHNGNGNPFSTSAVFGDDELLEGLAQGEQSALPSHGDYGPMNDISLSYQTPGIYSSGHHGLPMDQPHGNFSSTPDGDPIQSPFSHNFAHQYRSMGHHAFGNPMPYGVSPLGDNESRTRLQPGANPKSAAARNSLTPKTGGMAGLSINSEAGFGGRPIGAGGHPHHEKSQQWIQTPNSLGSFPASGFSSPHHASHIASAGMHDIIGRPGAASLPAIPSKIVAPQVSSQEAKKRRRRESHNLVERRRRDNINERIQDLSKLVPSHRLEDEKIRKAIQNGTPLSPSLGGISSPTQATSALAGPGARRAAGAAGNITTGLPIEDKDKGPNKGDILNGAVSWTRDLMWMLHLKLQQQEELINALQERGGTIPFEFTDDERRMQSELMETFAKVDEEDPKPLSYSRTAGTGLRVPHHTNYKGEALNGSRSADYLSISPNGHGTPGNEMMDGDQYLEFDDDNDNYLKEEEEFMDTSH